MQKKKPIFSILEKVIFFVLVFALWQGIYYIGCLDALKWWKPYAMPSPLGAVDAFIRLIGDNSLVIGIGVSLKRGIIGYIISIAVGVILGLLIATVPYLNRNLKSIILGLQTLPSVCWVPFAILWYGINESAIVFVIVVGASFSIAIAVDSMIHNINPLYIRAAKTMGINKRDLYLKIILRAGLPELLSGLKQGWSFAWRALMAGEVMSASEGLGQVLLLGRDLADINQVVVVMLVIIIIGIVVDRLVFNTLEQYCRNKMGLNK